MNKKRISGLIASYEKELFNLRSRYSRIVHYNGNEEEKLLIPLKIEMYDNFIQLLNAILDE